jgi:hypothetical protein
MEEDDISSAFSPSVEVSAAAQTETRLIHLGDSLPSEYEAHFGRLNIEWGSLDYAIRLACKRIEGLGLETDEGRKIMELWLHKDILDRLKKAAESDTRLNKSVQSELANLIGRIGTRKDKGHLYDRRDMILHSFWAVSPEVWQGLLRLTEPVLNPS